MVKGCIVARVLPPRCIFFYYPTIPFFTVYFLFALFSDEPEIFLPEYSQTAILHAAHFRRVVKHVTIVYCEWGSKTFAHTKGQYVFSGEVVGSDQYTACNTVENQHFNQC